MDWGKPLPAGGCIAIQEETNRRDVWIGVNHCRWGVGRNPRLKITPRNGP